MTFKELTMIAFENNDYQILDWIHECYLNWCYKTNSEDMFKDGDEFQPEFQSWFMDNHH